VVQRHARPCCRRSHHRSRGAPAARAGPLGRPDRPGVANGPQAGQELHARFGGDEFCFLIPDLDNADHAWIIAERFREAVERYAWTSEDERLDGQPVKVDVGIVCLFLGAVAGRRPIARTLANSLLAEADRLMYEAKTGRANASSRLLVRIDGGALVPFLS
jgi:predicted signal transduction protein with EAL and GGDEF domain